MHRSKPFLKGHNKGLNTWRRKKNSATFSLFGLCLTSWFHAERLLFRVPSNVYICTRSLLFAFFYCPSLIADTPFVLECLDLIHIACLNLADINFCPKKLLSGSGYYIILHQRIFYACELFIYMHPHVPLRSKALLCLWPVLPSPLPSY